MSFKGNFCCFKRYSCSKVKPFRITSKVDKFVFNKGKCSFMFLSLFTILAINPSKCCIVALSRVALGKDVYVIYKPYCTRLESKTITYSYEFLIEK